jgi:hypothetical protein
MLNIAPKCNTSLKDTICELAESQNLFDFAVRKFDVEQPFGFHDNLDTIKPHDCSLDMERFNMPINSNVLAIDHEGCGAGEEQTEVGDFLGLGEAGE